MLESTAPGRGGSARSESPPVHRPKGGCVCVLLPLQHATAVALGHSPRQEITEGFSTTSSDDVKGSDVPYSC